jgi:para-aminobenzoate synthetase/4-amino-4-deoxychorismate lyase
VGSGSFGLLDPVDTIVARRVDDVASAVDAAEEAAREGLWVAGFVAYEAAPAFNPMLTVRPLGLHDRMRELPLARFQSFRRRVPLDAIDSIHFPAGEYNVSGWTADALPEGYRDDLATIGRAIMAGEVAQLKHTFRLHAAFNGDPAALYRDLLLSQRGPHAVCMDAGRFHIVSASPQGFFRRVGNRLAVRPVLATIRRGRWLEEDLHLAELLRTEGEAAYVNRLTVKELEAELAELGEPATPPGSKRYELERLETVWQLTANLRAQLDPGTGLGDVFAALFPLASLTGVPKVEAMALVAATEQTPRGVYCGAIGYLVPTEAGDVDGSFNVAVRTAVIDQDEGVAEYGVGASITNRSEVVSAFEEARTKAKVLVDRRPDFQLVAEIRHDGGAFRDPESKLAMLAASAEYFGFAVDLPAAAEVLRLAVADVSGDSVVTLLLDRNGEMRTEVIPAPPWNDGPGSADVLTGVLAAPVVSSENVYLFHNTTNRRFYDSLQRDHPDVDVVFVCNESGEVAGATDGNLVCRIGGGWATPPVSCGTTATAFRSRLLANGVIAERVVTIGDLIGAEQIAVIDDMHGWRPVELVS